MSIVSDDGASLGPLADQLKAAGVRDVKFFFQPDVNARPISETKDSIQLVLGSYLDGKYELMGKLGDSTSKAISF